MASSHPPILLNREKARLDRFDFVLGLSRSLSSTQLDTLKNIFTRNGFQHMLVDDPKLSQQYLLFLAYNDVIGILRHAEKVTIYKKAYTHSLMESKFKLKRVLSDRETKSLDPQIKELEQTAKFTFAKRKEFLFTEAINTVDQTVKEGKTISGDEPKLKHTLTKLLEKTQNKLEGREEPSQHSHDEHDDHHHHHHHNDDLRKHVSYSPDEPFDDYIGLFTPSELCMIVASILRSIEVDSCDSTFFEIFNIAEKSEMRLVSPKLLDQLKRLEHLEFVTPLHNKNLKIGLESINNLTDYFGQNVGIYFKFMEFYTKWLIPPAIAGILVFVLGANTTPRLKFILETSYCLMIMIWATLFVEYWQRRSSEICTKWHTYAENFNTFDMRYDFKGATRINMVTGLPGLYFSRKQKLLRYAMSLIAHTPVMLLSLFLMIVFLNAKGYVLPQHPIYIERLARMAQAGGLFDKATMWKLIPTLLQVTSMVILARINKFITFITTQWENHKYQTSYNNSIVAKRFIFEVITTFLHLMFIVFYRQDFNMLKNELILLYATDEIRRLATETLLPHLKKNILGVSSEISDKKGDGDKENEEYVRAKVAEINLTEYDDFDDYLEMIIQFGYITLFAPVFPLSSALSLLFNGAEVISDYYKLGRLYRRPMPVSVRGIGTWKNALDIMSYLCVLSNCFIMSYSPSLYSTITQGLVGATEEDKEDMLERSEDNLEILEHFMLFTVYMIRKIVKNEPFWVRIYLRRQNAASRVDYSE